jgi:protein gp37
MVTKSTIEWTDNTWNPVTGCSKTSPGCKNCYAERMAARLKAMGVEAYRDGFKVTLQPKSLLAPKKWRSPKTVFVNSMSDLFHRDVPTKYIQQVFEVMCQCPQHRFQVLTKRAGRLREVASQLPWPKQIWQGVSVESKAYYSRVHDLQQVPAAVRFLSCEPLLGPLDNLPLDGIHWVIVGGESGPRSRPMDPGWVRSIRDQCQDAGVSFFFKQWGGVNKKKTGRILDGATYDALPI